MFTEKDYIDYFESIMLLEQKALEFTEKLASRLGDNEIKEKIEIIKKDEERHCGECRRLLGYFSK